jgi:hypothetical protein
MDVSRRSRSTRGPITAALACVATAASLLCALPVPASALERDVPLRFLPPAGSEVTGYRVYVTDDATGLEDLWDVGLVLPDSDGVARTAVMLDAARSYHVGMTAYNDTGESALSNQIQVAAEAPVCDPALCDDGDPCTADSCDTAGCLSTQLPDGTVCNDGYVDTVDDQCVAGVCEGVLLACYDHSDCDDGNVCNGLEACDGGTVCLEGIPLDCGTPTACTVPSCDPVEGCRMDSRPDGTPCDDGMAETSGDSCSSGVCQGFAAPAFSVDAISPQVASRGRHDLTIHGQGFAPRAQLSFHNGQGRVPRIRFVRFVDDRTLEARVRIHRHSLAGDWDVIVTLPDGREAFLPGALRIDR